MKIIKRIIITIVCIPIALIVLLAAFEMLGMLVNHIAAGKQTRQIKECIETELTSVEIIDIYSKTGNTSGTGNHVDMLSVIVFKTEDSLTDIEDKLKDSYEFDEWSCWIQKMDVIAEWHEKGYYSFCDEMNIPEELNDCYLIYVNKSAPFPDNIEGH